MFCVAITVYSSAKDKEQNGLDLDAVWEIPWHLSIFGLFGKCLRDLVSSLLFLQNCHEARERNRVHANYLQLSRVTRVCPL